MAPVACAAMVASALEIKVSFGASKKEVDVMNLAMQLVQQTAVQRSSSP